MKTVDITLPTEYATWPCDSDQLYLAILKDVEERRWEGVLDPQQTFYEQTIAGLRLLASQMVVAE